MRSDDVLLPGDPLIDAVRRHSARDVDAHEWLLDSARHWAVGEFLRREDRRDAALEGKGRVTALDLIDIQHVEERIEALKLHQVAVHVEWRRLDERVYEKHLRSLREFAETVYVGFLRSDATREYLSLQGARGEPKSGMLTTLDIFELPPEYRVKAWPYSPSSGAPLRPPAGRTVEEIMECASRATGDEQVVVSRTEYERVKAHVMKDYGEYMPTAPLGRDVTTLFGSPLVIRELPQPRMNT